uniref:Uncharacterized protein n=1 Tax=Strongyloides papillosus TaxID=174720 RepID=A0A0N5BRP7_STREA
MNFIIYNFIILLSLFIPIIRPCGNFNCPKFTNHARITFKIYPSLALTYSTDPIRRRKHQWFSFQQLEERLNKIPREVINDFRVQHRATPDQAREKVVIVNRLRDILNVTVIYNECMSDCDFKQSIAPAGTHFINREGRLRKRLVDTVCLNGEIIQEQSRPLVVELVYDISVAITGGRTFCQVHWNGVANAIQRKMEKGSRGTFIGKPVITKV